MKTNLGQIDINASILSSVLRNGQSHQTKQLLGKETATSSNSSTNKRNIPFKHTESAKCDFNQTRSPFPQLLWRSFSREPHLILWSQRQQWMTSKQIRHDTLGESIYLSHTWAWGSVGKFSGSPGQTNRRERDGWCGLLMEMALPGMRKRMHWGHIEHVRYK